MSPEEALADMLDKARLIEDDEATPTAKRVQEWRAAFAELQQRMEGARLVTFQMQQSAAAITGDPDLENAIAASWVIEITRRILAALAAKEKP